MKEESSIIVLQTNNSKHRRKWDKFQFCLFCGEKKAKIARHLEDMHDKELEVAKILSITIAETDDDALKKQKQKERARLFNLLRKRGNFNHNQNVLQAKEGVLIVEKRPTGSERSYLDFLPCEFCLGFYEIYVLKRHVIRCQERPSGTSLSRQIQSSASMLLYCGNTPSDDLRKVLGKMIVDDVSQCVKGDDLILKFGNRLCSKLRKDGDQHHHISNKLRELARLVIETRRSCDAVLTLTDCLIPINFDFLIEAVTELSGWNDEIPRIARRELDQR